jgi:HEAT repeat protein
MTSLLLFGGGAQAAPKADEMITKLLSGNDFRVRVQAALELGKGRNDFDAIEALVRALDDSNASVRAAAAAALKNLRARSALKALRAHQNDPSDAVRAQIKATISTLEQTDESSAKTQVLVKLGNMRNSTSVKSTNIETQLAADSRRKLGELPGIEVLIDGVDSAKESKKRKAPVVLVEGTVQKLKASREGGEIVYSAAVEYLMHTMPDQSIAAKVSGSASATLSQEEAKDQARAAELRRAVLEAAIESALRRAPRALYAAARL